MAQYRFTAKLSESSLKKLQSDIDKYRNDLPNRVAKALDILAGKGIKKATTIANQSATFGNYVVFTKEVPTISGNDVSTIMKGESIDLVVSWQGINGTIEQAEVNALLMLEFGSGAYADGQHRGTFPNQIHAFDPKGWNFKNVGSDVWMHSYGYKPKKPMLEAYQEMEREIRSAFEEAFK